jgi:SAM-dependent methyltransferase
LEDELRLLGDVTGRRILEIGCGGGQCSIAFAKQGATVTAIDISDAQIAFARSLAQSEKVTVQFVQGRTEDLSAFASESWDILFSVYTFQYVADMAACLSECHRLLRPAGRLVFSLDHPLRDCFVDLEEGEMSVYPTRSYGQRDVLRWPFNESGVWLESYHRSISDWIDLLHSASLRLQRLLEPPLPHDLADELYPNDSPLAPLRNLPPTIIFLAEKPKG